MVLFKILLIFLFSCILTIIIILKMGTLFKNLYTEKEKQTRREKLLPYLWIKTVPELLKVLETKSIELKKYYFETGQEACEIFFQYAILQCI